MPRAFWFADRSVGDGIGWRGRERYQPAENAASRVCTAKSAILWPKRTARVPAKLRWPAKRCYSRVATKRKRTVLLLASVLARVLAQPNGVIPMLNRRRQLLGRQGGGDCGFHNWIGVVAGGLERG